MRSASCCRADRRAPSARVVGCRDDRAERCAHRDPRAGPSARHTVDKTGRAARGAGAYGHAAGGRGESRTVASDLDTLLAADNAFLVALNSVTDPQNLGAITRSAETAGATGLLLPRHRSSGSRPRWPRRPPGAIEHLPIASVSGIPARWNGRAGPAAGPSVSTATATPCSSSSRSPIGRSCWCSGAEGRGLGTARTGHAASGGCAYRWRGTSPTSTFGDRGASRVTPWPVVATG